MMLSQEEIRELTGHVRSDAQARELRHMGIEHKIRRDGSVAVSRAHAEEVLSGGTRKKKVSTVEPDWEAARA